MKFLNVPRTKLELNQDTRDHALAQLLIQVGVNQFLLKGIYAQVHSTTYEKVEKSLIEVEENESASVFFALGKYAADSNVSQLLRPPSQEAQKE